MMFANHYSCLTGKGRILVKEKEAKFFRFKSIKEVKALLETKKELFSLDENAEENKIVRVDDMGLQDFVEIKTFSGSTIYLGKDSELFVDGSWIKVFELEYYEKLYHYDLLVNHFKETHITSIKPATQKSLAYRVIAENETGLVVDNFIVRFLEIEATESND